MTARRVSGLVTTPKIVIIDESRKQIPKADELKTLLLQIKNQYPETEKSINLYLDCEEKAPLHTYAHMALYDLINDNYQLLEIYLYLYKEQYDPQQPLLYSFDLKVTQQDVPFHIRSLIYVYELIHGKESQEQ